MGRKVTCEAYTDRGIVGPRGASAYEQAVEGGYTGTLEDFEAALASDINTVAGSISDVNTVGANISDVNTVAGISSDVSSVAGNATDVSTVAGISSDVTQVASISSAVSTVSSHDSDVTLVADNMASVMTTASHVGDVQAVASVASDVSTVAGISSNVTSVAGNATNINKVANNESNINTVAGNTSNINTVVTNLTDIQTVANNATGISSVAGDLTNIDTVASNLTDIGTVATNISDVSSVAGDLSNIDTAVANLAAINAAPTAASNAATSATNAQTWAEGTDAQVAALGGTKSSKGWAARAEEIITSIGTVMRYKGSVADYAALQAIQNPTLGDTYNVLDTGSNYTWDGTNWDAISSTVDLSAYRTSAAQDVIDAGKADNTNKVNGAPLSNTGSYFYGECTTAATTTAKEVSIPSITELKAGQVILVKPTNTADGAGMTLKLNNFTAYTVLYCGASITTSTDSIVMQANTPSWFVFDGTYWRFAGYGRDNNTTYTINYMLSCGIHLAGTGTYAVTRYALLMQKLDGTWEKLQNTSEQYTTATTKTVNTRGFVLGDGQIRYYSTTTAKANGAVISNSYLYEKYTSIDARYSFNCGATPSWSDGDYIYLVGTIGADGLFYLDSTTWWANALPNSNDGKVYVRVGKYVSDAYKISLDYMHPVFYHDGTSVKQYVVAGNKADLDPSTGKLLSTQVPDLSDTYQPLLATSDGLKIKNLELTDQYTVVGSPTITSGVISNFSSSAYVYTKNTFSPSTNPWLFVTKAKFASFTNKNTIISYRNNIVRNFQLSTNNGANAGKFVFYASSNGTGNDIADNFMTTNPVVSVDTWYWIAVAFTGTAYEVRLSTDGETWNTVITVNSSTPIYQNAHNSFGFNSANWPEPIDGEIDFNETYFKINDEYWIYPLVNDYAKFLRGDFLQTRGGTMEGAIGWDGADGKTCGVALTENGRNMDVGWTWSTYDGAGMAFRSSTFSGATGAGSFIFFARSPSGTKNLIGKTTGSLTWDDKEILNASHMGVANGVASLDSNGKVPTSQLPSMGSSRNVGEIVESTVPLTDAGLHLLDGSLLSGSGSYADFVTHMAGVYADHPELFTTEADWQTSVTNYGVCGKFVYDSVNNTVRLPKKSSTERHLIYHTQTENAWCDVYSDGWCEQGDFFTGVTGTQTITLAKPFLDTNYSLSLTESYTGTLADRRAINNANKTNSSFQIFVGSASTIGIYWQAKGYVDISAYKMSPLYQYIVIANSTKTPIEVDIDEIATDLNGKADVDLGNVSNTSGFRKLIEVYNNGTDGYKVFEEYDPSTGTFIGKWCEQWGCHTFTGSAVYQVTLFKEFIDTNYNLQHSLFYQAYENKYVDNCTDYSTTTITIAPARSYVSGMKVWWRAEGYIN